MSKLQCYMCQQQSKHGTRISIRISTTSVTKKKMLLQSTLISQMSCRICLCCRLLLNRRHQSTYWTICIVPDGWWVITRYMTYLQFYHFAKVTIQCILSSAQHFLSSIGLRICYHQVRSILWSGLGLLNQKEQTKQKEVRTRKGHVFIFNLLSKIMHNIYIKSYRAFSLMKHHIEIYRKNDIV